MLCGFEEVNLVVVCGVRYGEFVVCCLFFAVVVVDRHVGSGSYHNSVVVFPFTGLVRWMRMEAIMRYCYHSGMLVVGRAGVHLIGVSM